MNSVIDFRTSPDQYQHWRLSVAGNIATIALDVNEQCGLFDGYQLKLNSYDLGVDIELADAVNRLRFEHPSVQAVVLRSAKENVFCAGANIKMLSTASHAHKVNFCKFTNETRLAIEDASIHSQQRWITAINGPAAGGGYELAAATDHIILINDSNTTVSLPEVPLLAVLPGTGGLTRLVDKRHVRSDHADVFCTKEEGIKADQAVRWNIVDELASKSDFDTVVQKRALSMAAESDRPDQADGIRLDRIERTIESDNIRYSNITVRVDRDDNIATIVIQAPQLPSPSSTAEFLKTGCESWPVAAARELDDLLLHLRLNEPELGLLVLETRGAHANMQDWDKWLHANSHHWLVRETLLLWKRTLKRLDLSARSIYALITPDSCYCTLLAELAFVADRCYMFENDNASDGPFITLGDSNFGGMPMGNGLSRLQTRFLNQSEQLEAARSRRDIALDATQALELGLVTEIFDDIDWDDEIHLALMQRTGFSADALTAMEANLRFAGPETLETKIFGRLSAWQNWVFQRPNAAGDDGALKRYGSGTRPDYDKERT